MLKKKKSLLLLYGEWPERAGSKLALRKLLCGSGEQREGSDPGEGVKGVRGQLGWE